MTAENRVRFVRFAPQELRGPGPELDKWIAAHVPRGITAAERLLQRHPHASVMNRRYKRTLDTIGRARFPRTNAFILAMMLVEDGESALAWKANGGQDYSSRLRSADAAFNQKRHQLLQAARTLHLFFRDAVGTAELLIWKAVLEGMGQIEATDIADDDGSPVMVLASPFPHWLPPKPSDGRENSYGAMLAALMRRLSDEIEDASPKGMHSRQLGPFIYPHSIVGRRSVGDVMVNGLIYAAVRAARRASGAKDAFLDRGAPMPLGGKPHWPIACAYVQDITGQCLLPRDARERFTRFLKRNPGLEFWGWKDLG